MKDLTRHIEDAEKYLAQILKGTESGSAFANIPDEQDIVPIHQSLMSFVRTSAERLQSGDSGYRAFFDALEAARATLLRSISEKLAEKRQI